MSTILGSPTPPPTKDSFEKPFPNLFLAMLGYMIFGAIVLVIVFGLLSFFLGPSNAFNPFSILVGATYLLFVVNRPLARKKTRISK